MAGINRRLPVAQIFQEEDDEEAASSQSTSTYDKVIGPTRFSIKRNSPDKICTGFQVVGI